MFPYQPTVILFKTKHQTQTIRICFAATAALSVDNEFGVTLSGKQSKSVLCLKKPALISTDEVNEIAMLALIKYAKHVNILIYLFKLE